ncbi:MAG: alpha/beta hydrolase [Lutibacter sp.]
MHKIKSKYLLIIVLNICLTAISAQSIMAVEDGYELIAYTTEDGGVIEASYFEGGKDYVVIFAHGAVFNKESWYFMAERLKKEGVSSFSIDFRGYGNSKKGTTDNRSLDILGAIDFLKEKGFGKIAIVGASMGGAAVLNALGAKTDPVINRVALLAPAGGVKIVTESIKKMFIVSKEERLFTAVNNIFDESAQPKELKIYPGSFHAQNMFKAEYGDELTDLIINFLIIPK